MKRYRHYNKDKAIVLSCFGSVIEQNKYLELKKLVAKKFHNKKKKLIYILKK